MVERIQLITQILRGFLVFRLHRINQIAKRLELSREDLVRIAGELETPEGRSRYVREFTIYHPTREKKTRDVISVIGDLRTIQGRLHRRLFSPAIEPTPQSHGSVRDRSIKTNADTHRRSRFLYLTDIASFYPTIRSQHINDFFLRNGCLPGVAHLLTRLTTLDYHLALGLATSPILAEAIVRPADQRIADACQKHGVTYTRYVDDICISADFDLSNSGIPATVRQILIQSGFKIRASKDQFFRVNGQSGVTGVCIKRGRLSALPIYVKQLETDLHEAKSLSLGHKHEDSFYLPSQLKGRIRFVAWLNDNQAKPLRRLFRSINWKEYMHQANQQRLVVAKPRFEKRKPAAPS